LTFFVESAWKVFTDVSIPSPRSYFFFNHPGNQRKDELWTIDGGSHTKQRFIRDLGEHYKERKNAEKEVQLHVYLTKTMDCHSELVDFSKNYNFYLNIKVAQSYNEHELSYLINKPESCTVEAFTEDDYRDLARHLIPPVIPQATTKRDEQTAEVLRNLQEEEDNGSSEDDDGSEESDNESGGEEDNG